MLALTNFKRPGKAQVGPPNFNKVQFKLFLILGISKFYVQYFFRNQGMVVLTLDLKMFVSNQGGLDLPLKFF